MASRTKTYSSSFHNKEDSYSHLFYPKKPLETKPPLHTKSVHEDLEEKSFKHFKASDNKKHKKNTSSFDFEEEKKYDYLKQKTQMILNDLNQMKGRTSRPIEEPHNTISKKNLRFIEEKSQNKTKNLKKLESNSDSSMESKENRSFYSNMKKSNQKDLTRNKRDIEVLSNYHEKDMEIIDLKNRISKYELEAKSVDVSLKKLSGSIEKYKQEIAKLQQEKGLKDKEIEYLKKFRGKLEDDVKNLKKEIDIPRNSHWEQVVTEKNKEIIELKEKLLINNAEHRIVLTNEKDRLENEIKSRDSIIKEKNRIINDLEQYKAQNVPYFEGYQNISLKMKEFERNNSNLSEENKNLKEKLEAKREEKSLIDSFMKDFKLFFMQVRLKLIEIGDMGSQIFEISRQILSGEEINIDLLVGLVKPSMKNKPKKQENIINNNSHDAMKENFEDLGTLKGLVFEIYDKFKRNINEIYEVYVKKCGENCNIQ